MAEEKTQGAAAVPQPTGNGGAQAQGQQQPVQQAQAQARPCPQDCRLCSVSQQVFCSAKMLFDLSRRQMVLEAAVGEMAKALADIQAQMQKKEEAIEFSIPLAEGEISSQ
jgi:hypothetical protein